MKTISDKYLIVGEHFRNVERDGRVTGFQVGIRVPYYRGVYLSLFRGIELTVDGEQFAPEQISVTLGGKTYPLARLADEPDDRWEYGQLGILTVDKPGGLAPGEHEVELKINLDIYYMRYSTLIDYQPNPTIDNSTWGIITRGANARVALSS